MKHIVYAIMLVTAATCILVVHSLQAQDEEWQAEQFAEWVEANEDNIVSFLNKDADYDYRWYLENADNVHKYLERR